MARNIEIKARISSVECFVPRAAAIADEGPVDIHQDDTFFQCTTGRLKLRTFATGEGELIYYRRDDLSGPKESFYLRSPVATPDVLRESLSLACGTAGRVIKHRVLFLVGRTRIHLDRVQGLGDFLELEVVLGEGDSAADGMQEADRIMALLSVEASQLVEGAYVDLLGSPDGSSGGMAAR